MHTYRICFVAKVKEATGGSEGANFIIKRQYIYTYVLFRNILDCTSLFLHVILTAAVPVCPRTHMAFWKSSFDDRYLTESECEGRTLAQTNEYTNIHDNIT